MTVQRFALGLLIAVLAVVDSIVAQPRSLNYPRARREAVTDDYFGTRVSDPYRWMEDAGSPELRRWVDAEIALTSKYLEGLRVRDSLKARITELWNYERVAPPEYIGGRWFYTRNTGLQRQPVVWMREKIDGPETVVLDPNVLSADGSIALSGFAPSPDGRHVAYGQSEGGADWSTFHVRELVTGRQLPDEIRWTRAVSVAWTNDGRGFFYGRYPQPRAGTALHDLLRDKKIYYHALGTPQSDDQVVYARPEEPLLFIEVEIDESGRYLFFQTLRSISRNELFVKDLVDPSAPDLDGPVRPLYVGHTASYKPLGVIEGVLYLLTDRDAPNKKVVAVPIESPEPDNWKTIVPETTHAIDTARLVAGRIAVNRLVDVVSEVRFYTLDGRPAGEVTTPGLGSVSGPFGRF